MSEITIRKPKGNEVRARAKARAKEKERVAEGAGESSVRAKAKAVAKVAKAKEKEKAKEGLRRERRCAVPDQRDALRPLLRHRGGHVAKTNRADRARSLRVLHKARLENAHHARTAGIVYHSGPVESATRLILARRNTSAQIPTMPRQDHRMRGIDLQVGKRIKRRRTSRITRRTRKV